MTRTLFLLRHAKAEVAAPGQADEKRALSSRGRKQTRAMARHLRDLDAGVELVVCSPSRRTRETLAGVRKALAQPRVKLDHELYLASTATLLACVRSLPSRVVTAMLIGHNPGLHNLAVALSGSAIRGQTRARMRMIEKFSTGALCIICFKTASWQKVGRGNGTLRAYVRPADL